LLPSLASSKRLDCSSSSKAFTSGLGLRCCILASVASLPRLRCKSYGSTYRQTTNGSSELFKVFEEYLYLLVQESQEPVHISLDTAIPTKPIIELTTWQVPATQGGRYREPKKLNIRVLTPAFYSRFVHYAYTSEAFDRESIFTDERNRTLWISQPHLLPLLLNKSTSVEAKEYPNVKRSFLDELRWNLLRKLRCAPASPPYAVFTPSKAEFMTEDVRALPFSELDQYMRSVRGSSVPVEYRRIVTKFFLAQRFGFGFAEVLGMVDRVVRVLLCCLGAYQLVDLRARSHDTDIGGCSTKMLRDVTVSACFRDVREAHGEWSWLIGTMIATSACNGYGLLKGYK
jgi:hypothetical protein